MVAVLKITDGTNTVDLLDENSGFILKEWEPIVPDYKEGGVWQNSPLADGQVLSDKRFDMYTENLVLSARAGSQNSLITRMRALRNLLEQAAQYSTTTCRVDPVWIQARASCEDNMRYALVNRGRLEKDGNPYSQPFLQPGSNAVMQDLTLVLQHGFWTETRPGWYAACVEESNDEYSYYRGALILNPGFETAGGGGADIWANWTENAGTGTLADDAVVFWQGAHAARMVAGAGLDTYVQQTVVVTASTPYRLEFMYRSSNIQSVPRYQVIDATAAVDIIATSRLEVYETAVWTRHVVDFTTPVGCISCTIRLRCAQEATHTSWFDLVQLRQRATNKVGRVATCDREVYVANKRNMAQLTSIYTYDASLAAFSANLVDSTDFDLLNNPCDINDVTYFGIAARGTSIGDPDGGPFSSLVFDISVAAGGTGLVWYYWNGAWVVIPTAPASIIVDNTNNNGWGGFQVFDTLGVNSVSWRIPSDWTTTTINGVTGYWIALIATNGSVGANVAHQQNRRVYTVTWPYIEIADDQVAGDLPGLIKHHFNNESAHSPTAAALDDALQSDRLILGLRSVDRGSNFVSHINLGDTQNPPNIYTFAEDGFTTDVGSPSGRAGYVTLAAPGSAHVGAVIDRTLASEYCGVYRAFLRGVGDALPNPIFNFALWVAEIAPLAYHEAIAYDMVQYFHEGPLSDFLPYNEREMMIDLGQVTLPSLAGGILFDIQVYGNAAGEFWAHDLILMPIDEWAMEASRIGGTTYSIQIDRRLSLDSITYPNKQVVADFMLISQGAIIGNWLPIATSPVTLAPNRQQRLYLISEAWNLYGLGIHGSFHETLLTTQAWRQQRYLSMRGDG